MRIFRLRGKRIVLVEDEGMEATRRLQRVAGHVQTRSPNGIQSVWLTLSARYGTKAAALRRICCEWKPSDQDRTFVDATWSDGIPRSYSFLRPRT